MSNSADTLAQVWHWAAHGGEKAIEFTEFVIKYSLMHVVTGAIAGAVGAYISARNIHKGVFKEHTLNVSETLYTPSGKPAENGEEYIDQELITKGDGFMFAQAFKGKTGKELAKRVGKISKLPDLTNLMIFDNLDKIVKTEDLAKFKMMVSKQWRGHWSSVFNKTAPIVQELGERERPVKEVMLVLPVIEESSEGKSCKILFVPQQYLLPGGLPKAKNLRVQMGRDDDGSEVFEHAPDHELSNRLRTMEKIRDIVNQDRDYWLSTFGVEIYTGKTRQVAAFTPSVPVAEPSPTA